MHIHILGICGTFMGSLALIARALGHRVSGSDENVYPPMSTQLAQQGIELIEGYENDHLKPEPDWVIVGNAMSRGKPVVERLLNSTIRYTSGPQWLAQEVLYQRWVIAVAGTHGKTTTASMVAWILTHAGLNPGYLIGGVPKNLPVSASLGADPFFVIEADEYDSAFFDKRSKFVHYRPRTVILNNLEYDHADIFPNLEAIKTQFHHLVRTVPANGRIIIPADDHNIASVLVQGCWTERETFDLLPADANAKGWSVSLMADDGSQFDVLHEGKKMGEVCWSLTGQHNVSNGLAAILAARHAGVPVAESVAALCEFESVKRRMETIYQQEGGVTLYDDFAHHPTAIAMTLEGLRKRVDHLNQGGRILAIIEPRSNTMKQGVHQAALLQSIVNADKTIWFEPTNLDWDMAALLNTSDQRSEVSSHLETIIDKALQWAQPNDHIVVMSNGGFGGLPQRLIKAVEQQFVS